MGKFTARAERPEVDAVRWQPGGSAAQVAAAFRFLTAEGAEFEVFLAVDETWALRVKHGATVPAGHWLVRDGADLTVLSDERFCERYEPVSR